MLRWSKWLVSKAPCCDGMQGRTELKVYVKGYKQCSDTADAVFRNVNYFNFPWYFGISIYPSNKEINLITNSRFSPEITYFTEAHEAVYEAVYGVTPTSL